MNRFTRFIVSQRDDSTQELSFPTITAGAENRARELARLPTTSNAGSFNRPGNMLVGEQVREVNLFMGGTQLFTGDHPVRLLYILFLTY